MTGAKRVNVRLGMGSSSPRWVAEVEENATLDIEMSKAEAMIIHAERYIGLAAAQHMINNVVSIYLLDPEEPTPFVEALHARVEADRQARAERPDYPVEYPSHSLWLLFEELKDIWAGTWIIPCPFAALEKRVVALALPLSAVRIRRIGREWNFEIKGIVWGVSHQSIYVAAALCR